MMGKLDGLCEAFAWFCGRCRDLLEYDNDGRVR